MARTAASPIIFCWPIQTPFSATASALGYISGAMNSLVVLAMRLGRVLPRGPSSGAGPVAAFEAGCAKAGAAQVHAVEISEECVDLVRRNARRNGLVVVSVRPPATRGYHWRITMTPARAVVTRSGKMTPIRG